MALGQEGGPRGCKNVAAASRSSQGRVGISRMKGKQSESPPPESFGAEKAPKSKILFEKVVSSC